MARIVFNVFAHPAHYNSTFALANCLRELGHEVYYVSDVADYKGLVSSNGFPFYLVTHNKIFKHPLQVIFSFIHLFWKADALTSYLIEFKYVKSVLNAATCPTLFDKMMDELSPDLLIIDNDLPFNAIHLTRYNKPCAQFQYGLPMAMADFIPSSADLCNTTRYRKVELAWKKYLFVRSLRRIYHWLRYFGTEQYYLARMICYSQQDNRMKIDEKKNFYFRASGVPELILSHVDLDFPCTLLPHQFYVGPLVLQRNDTIGDYAFFDGVRAIKGKAIRSGVPLIYCSVNPREMSQIRECYRFIQRVIYAFNSIECELIMAIGLNIACYSFDDVGDNIHIFQTVPQCEVLKCADLMITHGDIQSLMECVINEVPVLVYPLPANWDHTGNSSRVLYHGIGLRGNIRSESIEAIQSKTNNILTNPNFKLNIRKLKKNVLERNEAVAVSAIFDKLLSPDRIC